MAQIFIDIHSQSTVNYDVTSINKFSLQTDHEALLIKKYRHLKPEHQKAIDIQINYFYEVDR